MKQNELKGWIFFLVLAALTVPVQAVEIIWPHANLLHFIGALIIGMVFIGGTNILKPVLRRKFGNGFRLWPFNVQMVLVAVYVPFSAIPVPGPGWLHVYMVSVGALSLINGVLSLFIGVSLLDRVQRIHTEHKWLWRLYAGLNISVGFLASSIILSIEAVGVSVFLYWVTGILLKREWTIGKLNPLPATQIQE